ncbi:MAG: MaoC/PaaZ C-terminal domain-containing protein [Promethearchaeota archaeon]
MAHLFWDDVEVGMEIPSYKRVVTLMELNRYAGANEEFVLIHMDRDYSQKVARLPDVIVMGNLKYAYLSNMMINWIGEDATLKRLSAQYRGMDIPGPALSTEPTMICKGKVTKKYIQDDDHYVECEVWTETGTGQVTTPGSAIVILPAKS